MTDRRAAHRYDLSLLISVRVPTRGESLQHGKTRDVSTRGVYLLVDHPMNQDSDFDLTMTLPTETTGKEAQVRAIARVVRVEEWLEDGVPRVGIGAAIRRYEIVRKESVAS